MCFGDEDIEKMSITWTLAYVEEQNMEPVLQVKGLLSVCVRDPEPGELPKGIIDSREDRVRQEKCIWQTREEPEERADTSPILREPGSLYFSSRALPIGSRKSLRDLTLPLFVLKVSRSLYGGLGCERRVILFLTLSLKRVRN